MNEGDLILLTIWFDPLELAARQGKKAKGTSPYTYRALGHDLAKKLRIEAVGIFRLEVLDRWRNITQRDLLDFFYYEIPSLIKKIPEDKLDELIEGVTSELAPVPTYAHRRRSKGLE